MCRCRCYSCRSHAFRFVVPSVHSALLLPLTRVCCCADEGPLSSDDGAEPQVAVAEYTRKVWRTPEEAPDRFLEHIYEFLETEIEHLGADHNMDVSELQEMAERMYEGQSFASEEWDNWFETSIQQIQDNFFGHQSHAESDSGGDE